MAKVAFMLDTLDGVDEGLKQFYVQNKETKKFELQVDGPIKTQADIDRVTTALNKERTDHKTTKEALKSAETKLTTFGELDPDDVTSKLEKLAQLEAAGTNPTADKIQALVDTGIQNGLKQATTKLQREVDRLTGELTGKVGEVEKLNGLIIGRQVDDAMRAAATQAKVIPEAVPDLLLIARSELKLVDGKVTTEDGRDPSQWLEDRKKVAPFYWAPAKGAGAGGGHETPAGKENPFTREGWNITAQGNLIRGNPAEAEKLALSAGVPKDAAGKPLFGQMPPAPAKK
jgi:hypothetical protein